MPNWLGDLVLATGFVGALLERFPAASVDLVVRAGSEALPLPHRGHLLAFDPQAAGAGAFGAALRGNGYDRFYVLPPSFSAAWMAWCSRAPERIGYRGQLRGPLLAPALRHRLPPRAAHLAQEYLDLLDPAPELEDHPPRLAVAPCWAEERLGPLCRKLPERFAALAPGAIYGPAKAWPAEHYRDLARALAADGLPVVVVGSPAEAGIGEAIREGSPGVLNWCGATDLAGLAAVLSRADLVVSNDSGPMHLAAALGRPQVAIFGSTSPAWTRPVNPRAAVLATGISCSPCFRRTCREDHYRCLREITPEQVLEAVRTL